MALKGSLRDFSLPDLFKLLNLSKKSGTLMLTLGDSRGYVCFREGEVFFATENWNRRPLGEKMVEAGIVTWDQVHEALDLQTNEDASVRLGQLLIRLGFITESQLQIFVEEQIQEAVFELLRWDQADFEFMTLDLFPAEDIGLAIGTEELILEGSRRLDEWSRIVEKIPSTEVVFKMTPLKSQAASSINLTADQWVVLTFVDGRRTVRDIAEATGFSSVKSCRVLYELLAEGLLERVQSLHTPGSPPAPVPEPLTKEEGRELAAAAKIAEMEEMLKEAAEMASEPALEAEKNENAREGEPVVAEREAESDTEAATATEAEEPEEVPRVIPKEEDLIEAAAVHTARARRPGSGPTSAEVLDELKALVLEGAMDFDVNVDIDSKMAELDTLKAKIDELIDLDDTWTEAKEKSEEIAELGITSLTEENPLRSDQAAEARKAFRKMRYGNHYGDVAGSPESAPATEAAGPLEATAEQLESGSAVEPPAVRAVEPGPADYAPAEYAPVNPEIEESPAIQLEPETSADGNGHIQPESDFGLLERLEEIVVDPQAAGPEVVDIDGLERELLEDIQDFEGVPEPPVEEAGLVILEMGKEGAEAPAERGSAELQAMEDGLAELEQKLAEAYEPEAEPLEQSFPSWAESPELSAEPVPDVPEEPIEGEVVPASMDPLDALEAVLAEELPEQVQQDDTFGPEPVAADNPPTSMDDFFGPKPEPAPEEETTHEPLPVQDAVYEALPSADAGPEPQVAEDHGYEPEPAVDLTYESAEAEELSYARVPDQEDVPSDNRALPEAHEPEPEEDAATELLDSFSGAYVPQGEPAEAEATPAEVPPERAELEPEPEPEAASMPAALEEVVAAPPEPVAQETYVPPTNAEEIRELEDAVLEDGSDVVFHAESRGPELAQASQYFAPVPESEPRLPSALSPDGTRADTFEEFYSDSFGLERELAELTGAVEKSPSRKVKKAPAAAEKEPPKSPGKAATPGKSEKAKPEKVNKGLLNRLIEGIKKQ